MRFSLERDLAELGILSESRGTRGGGSAPTKGVLVCESEEIRNGAIKVLKQVGLPVAEDGQTGIKWTKAVSEAEERLGADALLGEQYRFVGRTLKRVKSVSARAKEAGLSTGQFMKQMKVQRKKAKATRRRNKAALKRAGAKYRKRNKRLLKARAKIRSRKEDVQGTRINSLVEELQSIAVAINPKEFRTQLVKTFRNMAEGSRELTTKLEGAVERFDSDDVLEALEEALEEMADVQEIAAAAAAHIEAGGSLKVKDSEETLEDTLAELGSCFAEAMDLYRDLCTLEITEGDDCEDEDEEEEGDEDEEEEEEET